MFKVRGVDRNAPVTKDMPWWPEFREDLLRLPREDQIKAGQRHGVLWPGDRWDDPVAVIDVWIERAKRERVLKTLSWHVRRLMLARGWPDPLHPRREKA